MGLISWTEQDKKFGLDYSTKLGTYKDFEFDIRYDYDGDENVRPSGGLCLVIYFKKKRIEGCFGGIRSLTKYSEDFLVKFLDDYQKN
jgi:hypothetical protein